MLTESAIEGFAIKLFERLGYTYLHGPDIAPDSERPERANYGTVLLDPLAVTVFDAAHSQFEARQAIRAERQQYENEAH